MPLDNVDFLGTGQGASVYAWLTNSFGPGTTSTNVLDSMNYSMAPTNTALNYYNYNYNPQLQTLFSGLNLAPGTYDLMVVELDGTSDTGVPLDFTGRVFTSAPGVTLLGTFSTAQQSGTFAPGYGGWGNTSQDTILSGPLELSITGNDLVPTSAPEPSFDWLAGTLLLGVGFVNRRRFGASH